MLVVYCNLILYTEVGVPRRYASNNLNELSELEQAVNALRAHDGGDCPELGMTGILNALSLANPVSNVIVLTDASPKDENRTEEVTREAFNKENSIHFFLSRAGCGNFTPYLDVARETHGVVVNQIDEFEAFAKFADEVRRFTTGLLGGSSDNKKRQAPENCEDFTASVFTKSIDILFSSVTSGSVITVTTPAGLVDRIEPTGSIATYGKRNPPPGVYKLCSASATTFEYSLSMTSDLDFFVEYDVNVSRTSLPTPGNYNIVLSVRLHSYHSCRYSGQGNNFFL